MTVNLYNGQAQKKILHVTFNMGFGGTEQVIRQLVNHLPVSQFNSEILCIDGDVGEIGQRLKAEQGISIHKLKRQPGLDWRLVLDIRRLVKQGRFAIVHCHQYTPWFYGWLGSLGTGAGLIFTEHGRFHPDRYRHKAWLVNKLMAKSTHALVAISKATRQALVEYEFLPSSKIQVIYNGIQPPKPDLERVATIRNSLGLAGGELVFGTVSRLDPVKNQRMMLKAFSLFCLHYGSCRLLMVGDGPDRAMLENYARELGVDDKVVFTGFQSNAVDYLEATDIFLLSSHTEGTSMTLLEAMSLGKPCIVTRVGGNPELVQDETNGLLVPTNDSESMSNAMVRMAESTLLRRDLGEQASATFYRQFSAEKMAADYTSCYQHVVSL
ncbi:glycosyltransferase [Marinobacter sp. S6332]|uniref:glycosyltransferase n=1 Tax=Marinobacter sp. S6332 TaxID=2926403 RepID=UPI001FF66B5A|nr:glycosyltransferase [Marinobacter sp. S6332]MCK0163985.1 glycosyltransferase [Marinobacter sp. S6332]